MGLEQDISLRQTNLLRQVPPDAIAHGAVVPFDVIKQFIQGGMLLEFGSGTGEKGTYPPPFAFTGIEINSRAVDVAEQRHHVISLPGDVRSFWDNEVNLAMIVHLERTAGVLFQGLLANIVSNTDIRHVLRTADIAIKPGGHLLMAEPVRFDQLPITPELLRQQFVGHSLEEWRERWMERYAANAEAGLPYGVFAVARPGPRKDALDWATTADDVKRLIESPELERFARHVRPDGLDMYLRHLQYSQEYFKPTIMQSRNDEPLLGAIMVYRKIYGLLRKRHQLVYRYMPWGYKGATIEEMQQGKRRSKSYGLVKDLERSMPLTQKPPSKFSLLG